MRSEKLGAEVERLAAGARTAAAYAAERMARVGEARQLLASQARADDESVVDGVRAAAGAVDVGEGASGALAAATVTRVAAVAGEAAAGLSGAADPHLTEEEKTPERATRFK